MGTNPDFSPQVTFFLIILRFPEDAEQISGQKYETVWNLQYGERTGTLLFVHIQLYFYIN